MAKQPAKRVTAAEPDDDAGDADETADLPEAKVVTEDDRVDPLRTVKLVGFLVILLGGWTFIVLANHHHITAPVVFVCLAYFAILMTVVNLWRTGVAAADSRTVDDWQRPLGARGQLLKEKKTLLKAIKEAEFDLAMGKLSKADSDALIRDYRARAIEVIKELDRGGAAQLSAREQIEAEVKARLALDAQNKPSNRAKNEAAKQAAKSAKATAKTDAAGVKTAAKSANAESRRESAEARQNAGSVDRRQASAEPGRGEAAGATADETAGETVGEIVEQMAARGQLSMNQDEDEEAKPSTGESS